MYDIYTITNDDTLDKIARRFNTSSENLKQLNPNSNFTAGTNIIVPIENEYFEIYTIEKGDTLYNIARRYNTDYNLLALLNGLNTMDYIYPNTKIYVPKRDVKYYITKENDTLNDVSKLLEADIKKLIDENNNIYLKEGQLIVYKD